VRSLRPGSVYYAEKARDWLPAAVRDTILCRTAHLVRDPRDVFLSVNAFNRARGWHSFCRAAGDSDLEYARHLAHSLVGFCENQRADTDRPDCLVLRYEDLITFRDVAVTRLNRFLALGLSASNEAGAEHRTAHQTSAGP
jgi:hypothetical protein